MHFFLNALPHYGVYITDINEKRMQPMEDKIEDLLFRHFAGQLNETETEMLLEWLEAAPEHKRRWHEMSQWWAIAHVPHFSTCREADFRKYFGAITANGKGYKHQSVLGMQSIKVWQIAAILLVLLATGMLAFYSGRQTVCQQTACYEAVVPMGSQSRVVLPDRSVVWINAGSSVRYYEDNHEKTRHICLAGEAFFEITSDPERPFVVETDNLQVHVKGTRFNVKAYDSQKTVDVVLISGKVDVHIGGVIDEPYRLSPDERLKFDKQTKKIEKSRVQAKDFCAWKDGVLKFEEQAFTQIAEELERIYNIRIHIESERLKQERFSGSLPYAVTPDKILREIDMERKYEWIHNDSLLVIRDKKSDR